jgi:hypothetical protein
VLSPFATTIMGIFALPGHTLHPDGGIDASRSELADASAKNRRLRQLPVAWFAEAAAC